MNICFIFVPYNLQITELNHLQSIYACTYFMNTQELQN